MISKNKVIFNVINRDAILKKLTHGKIVANLGCIDDDLDLINIKLKNNRYLHKIISDSAKKCYGIDNNRKLLKKMEQLGFKNIFYGDIQDPNSYEINSSLYRGVGDNKCREGLFGNPVVDKKTSSK